jgi:hypothetical protein
MGSVTGQKVCTVTAYRAGPLSVAPKNGGSVPVTSDMKCNKDKLVSGSLCGKSSFKFKYCFPRMSLESTDSCRKYLCYLRGSYNTEIHL